MDYLALKKGTSKHPSPIGAGVERTVKSSPSSPITTMMMIRTITRRRYFLMGLRGGFASSTATAASQSQSPTATAQVPSADDEEEDVDPAASSSSLAKAVTPTVLQPRVVVYDGVCHLCHRGVKWVIQADKHRKIKFCCLQSQTADPYLRFCGVDRQDVLARFLFVEGPGLYHQGSTAALRVLSYLPLPYSALSTLMLLPTPLRDAVYDYVAKRRYHWFGKSQHCLVLQDKRLLERFIDREELMMDQD